MILNYVKLLLLLMNMSYQLSFVFDPVPIEINHKNKIPDISNQCLVEYMIYNFVVKLFFQNHYLFEHEIINKNFTFSS